MQFFFLLMRRPPRSTLFPYTTLFRSGFLHLLALVVVERADLPPGVGDAVRSEEHTSELQSQSNLVCRLLLEKKKMHADRRHRRQRFGVAAIPKTSNEQSRRREAVNTV